MNHDRSPTYLFVLVVLFVVWLVAYIVGMLVGKPNTLQTRRLPLSGRLTMIGVVLTFGAIGWLGLTYGTSFEHYAFWILLGLIAGAIGDLLMSGIFSTAQAELLALVAFGIGHLCYATAILTVQSLLSVQGTYLFIGAAIGMTAGCVIWLRFVRNPFGRRRMNIGSLVYGTVLFAAAGMGAGLATASSRMMIMAVGLALFAVSDVILAQYILRRRRFPYIRDVVWVIYSAGQLLIAFSGHVVLG
ncbi:MAG: lysoplasmalogenase [Anaerolineae bacterium]|nr:lysoplasmalogenase [Anaerolineae bacterium]